MVATTIGETTWNICISDNATPASGHYAWYILSKKMMFSFPFESIYSNDSAAGVSTDIQVFNIGHRWRFNNVLIRDNTEWQNLCKALGYWLKNESELYISIKNQWGVNICQFGTYATPETLAADRIKFKNLVGEIKAEEIRLNFDAKYIKVS